MRSYIKIFGPDVNEALLQIEKVCNEMDSITSESLKLLMEPVKLETKLHEPVSTCISEYLHGDWTISFLWAKEPSLDAVKELIKKLDEAIGKTKAKYTITTVSDPMKPPTPESGLQIPPEITSDYAVTYLKFYGPPIHKSFSVMEEIIKQRANLVSGTLLSTNSGPQLGVYDYAVIWHRLPSPSELQEFLKKIDWEFSQLGLMYNVVTKSYLVK